tara:strand:+ start:185 stop:397 length:213 start_codon:yes stop_codon:yes gene_type:complete
MKDSELPPITKAEQLLLSVLTYGSKDLSAEDVIKLCQYVRDCNKADLSDTIPKPTLSIVIPDTEEDDHNE